MIDQIKKIIEQVSNQEGNNGFPTDLTKQVTEETGNSILSGFKTAVSSGNLSQVTDLFQGGTTNLTSNPLVSGMITNLVGSLSGKLGIDQGTSTSFANSIIPKVIEAIVSKSKEGGFDFKDLIGSFSGGGIGDMIGGITDNLFNKDKSSESGGAMDALKDMFK